MTNSVMPHWLTKQAELSPHKVAIEQTNGDTLTFSQLRKESEVFARKVASFSIKKKEKIAILSTNHIEMVVAVHALSYINSVVVMLNTKLSKRELEYQLEQSEATLVITTDKLRSEKNLSFSNQKTYEEIKVLKEKDIPLATHIQLQDPFTMMFTSGTTGNPKAVIHTYNNHWWSAVSSSLNIGIEKHDKWLLTLPIFHVGGLSILLRSVIYGMSVLLMEKYDPDVLFESLMKKNVTIASLVTVMLKQLIERLNEKSLPADFRCLLLGGGSVPESLLQKVKEKEIPLFQSYGMTETSSQIVTLNAEDALRKLGSSGKPLFTADIKISRTNDEEVGEIEVRGPMVMDGYFNNDKANQDVFTDGWLKTGDLGYFDEEGFLYVVDRRTDLIISGGENVYPTEIENVILEIDGVSEVAVIGKKDDTWGQIPVACIVQENDTVSSNLVQSYVAKMVASYKVPKEIYFLESLPKNASNKVMRHKLLQIIESIS